MDDELSYNLDKLCNAAVNYWRRETPADILILSQKFRDEIQFDKNDGFQEKEIVASDNDNVLVEDQLVLQLNDSNEIDVPENVPEAEDSHQPEIEHSLKIVLPEKNEIPEAEVEIEKPASFRGDPETTEDLALSKIDEIKLEESDDPRIDTIEAKPEEQDNSDDIVQIEQANNNSEKTGPPILEENSN